MNIYFAIIKRDFRIAIRNPANILNSLFFFVIAVSLFPLAISPEASILKEIATGLIWVSVLLSVLLSLNLMFADDYDNGILEQMVISQKSLTLMVAAKVTTHWLLTGVPIMLLSPILGAMLFLDSANIQILMITLLLATPTLSLIGGIGSSLVVGIKNSGILLSLIVLPLYIPVLIFASSAVNNAQAGLEIAGSLYFLVTTLLASLMIVPFVMSIAIKVSLE